MTSFTIEQKYKDALDAVFSKGPILSYAKGQKILGLDDNPDGLYRIQSGAVKVYAVNAQGNQYVHIIYGVGELFPLPWILYKQRRKVIYEALLPTTLQLIDRDVFIAHMHDTTDFAVATFAQVVQQFNIYADRVDNLEYKYASERLAYRLLFLTRRFGVKRQDSWVLPGISQFEVANSINVTRETVSREFDKFRKRGMVDMEGKEIVIKDVVKLAAEVKGGITDNIWGLAPAETD